MQRWKVFILLILFILSKFRMQTNPFFYGNPVSFADFIGRRKELRRVKGRLLKGESTAIIGDPHIGKTSFLNYLASPEKREEFYENNAEKWYFSQINIQMLGGQFTPAQFWDYALEPIKDHIGRETADPDLSKHYTICAENNFGNFTLERLFSQLKKTSRRFILLIDEFDTLLYHPVLNNAEFYGGLRTLASNPHCELVLIIASRTPLFQLNSFTQEFNPTGSPFFNIFSEVTLGPLTDNGVKQLLSLAGDRFTTSDTQIIQTLAGHHPYLLQAASAVLWEAYEDEIVHTEELRRYVAKRLYRELDHFFSDTWNAWTPEMRKAFTAVAIAHQATLLPETTFRLSALLKEFHHWGPELGDLEERGLIDTDKGFETGYRVSSGILLTWLADELVKVVRSDKPFDTWLQDEKIDGAFLSTREKNAFKDAVTGMAKALGQGATAMIEALGKGLGSGVAGKMT